ncbi:MAG: aldolase [Alphaproteobacteria bacterium]|nr:aldolase [Alphaproteobacteria bacterium]
MMTVNALFRQRLISRHPLMGLFVKTASHQVIEVLEHSQLDFLIIDAEHAPFDRNVLDVMLLAARAANLPAIVRIPEPTEAAVLAPLDMGAAGIMIPHVQTAEQAVVAVGYARYGGRRGFSNSPRAGFYGVRPIAMHLEAARAETSIIAMIEDNAAIDNLEAIAAVDGIDALFLGRVDLAVTLAQSDVSHPEIEAAVQRVYAAARRTSKPLGALAGNAAAITALMAEGVGYFVLGTDQGLLRGAATDVAAAAKAAAGLGR